MMTSRGAWLLLACAVAACGGNDAAGPARSTPAHPAAPRPNLLLIVADDMGYTDLGSFGGEISTPSLDALAETGVRFANFHAAPVCAPARAMLLSGMDHHEAGMGSMDLKREFDNGLAPSPSRAGYGSPAYVGYLSARVAALPEVLRDAGYHTYMAGKWDLGRALVEEHNPAGRGFESSFAQTTGSALHLAPADGGAHGGIPRAEPLIYRENWRVIDELPPDYFSTRTFTDKIIEYIDANREDGRPFFAYLALTAPHFPLQAPEEWRDRYAGRYDVGYDVIRDRRVARALEIGVLPVRPDLNGYPRRSVPWSTLDTATRRDRARRMELYAAMIANMDHHVGRLVAYLREAGLLDETLVFFTSDNGAAGDFPRAMADGYDNRLANFGDRDSFIDYGLAWAEAGTAPFRDVKGSLAEGGVRVAAFATHRSIVAPGRVAHAYLTMQDVMPTFLDLAQAAHPGTEYRDRPVLPVRGRSFRQLLTAVDAPVHPPDEAIGWELGGQRALVRGDWKLLSSAGPEGAARWALFNLRTDPYERDDLASARPELTRDLVDAWHRYATDVGVAIIE